MPWVVRRDLKTGPRYYVRYSVDGKRFWFSAGKSRRIADLAKAKLETEIAEGRFLDRKRESDWTLGQFATVYLERMAKVKPKSNAWRRDRMKQVLRVLGADTPLEWITLETIDQLVDARLEEGRAVATVKGDVAVLRHALKKAFRWKGETGLSEYRLRDWEPIEDSNAREPVFLTPTEVGKVLRAARRRALEGERGDRQAEVLTRLALATGARVSEILELRWRALDRKTRYLQLPKKKRGERRGIEIDTGTLAAVLAVRRPGAGPDDPIFPSEAKTAAKDRYREFWNAVRKDAGVQRIRFHDLRHTFASEYLRRGGTLRDLQRILGHKTSRMTEKYAHFAKSFKPPKGIVWRGARAGATSRARRR